jgi:hypothetical protein
LMTIVVAIDVQTRRIQMTKTTLKLQLFHGRRRNQCI